MQPAARHAREGFRDATMDVKTLCLGLLSLGDACGYELKKRFEALFRHFFSAGYGSIYPALAELAEAGLVTCRPVAQEGKPERKVYRITAAGRRQFLDALHHTQPQHKLRSDFLAMLYFAELMDSARLDELLDDRLRQLREAEAHIAEIQSGWNDSVPVGARFVAGFGALLAQVAADYIESNRHMLARPEGHASTRQSPAVPERLAQAIDITGTRL
jgi:DNA-binding PadR family transcriptional regulator